MTDAALAVPLPLEESLGVTASRHGHRVVLRCSGAEELARRLPGSGATVAIVSASAQYLSARVVEACDAAGVRLIVAAADAADHRNARRLGLLDVVDGTPRWELLDAGSTAAAGSSAAVRSTAAMRSTAAAAEGRRETGSHAAEPGGAADPRPLPRVAQAGSGTAPVDSVTAPRRGRVIVVWGPHGAPGRTTVAIAVAAELAATGAAVLLADADTTAASVAPALGLLDESPGFAAACRLAASGAGALPPSEFDRLAAEPGRGRNGLRVLTGLGRPSRWPELGADRVTAVLEAARDGADYVVVDVAASLEADEELSSDLVAPQRHAATLASLAAADDVIVVGRADPIGVARLLRGHAELLETVDPARIAVVVNQVRASAVGMRPGEQIAQTLQRFGGIAAPWFLPHDPEAVDTALLRGTTLAESAPRSPISQAVRRLVAEHLLGSAPSAPAPPRRRGIRSRLGRRRARDAIPSPADGSPSAAG